MGCVYLHVCIMAPHGYDLSEKLKKTITKKSKRWQGIQESVISDQLEKAIRRCRTSHRTTNQSRRGRPPKMTPRTMCYLTNRQDDSKWLILGTGLINGSLRFCQSSDSAEVHCIMSTSMDDVLGGKKTLCFFTGRNCKIKLPRRT